MDHSREANKFIDLAELDTQNKPAERPLDVERIEATLTVTYNWGYQETRKELRDLYRKAKRAQWNAEDQLDWSIDIDIEKQQIPDQFHPLWGSDIYAHMDEKK